MILGVGRIRNSEVRHVRPVRKCAVNDLVPDIRSSHVLQSVHEC